MWDRNSEKNFVLVNHVQVSNVTQGIGRPFCTYIAHILGSRNLNGDTINVFMLIENEWLRLQYLLLTKGTE